MRRLVTIDLARADMAAFEAYEAEVFALLNKYGGDLEFRVRATDGATETHLLRFPNEQACQDYRSDPRRQALQSEWTRSGATSTALDVELVESLNRSPRRDEP